MQTEYDYSVIRPEVDKSKLRELAYWVAGRPVPVSRGASSNTRKPVLRLRRWNGMNANANRNIYGNDIYSWRTRSASSSTLSPSEIAIRNRREKETKTALRELGRMVRGF